MRTPNPGPLVPRLLVAAATLVPTAIAAAQRLPVPDDPERTLVLIPLSPAATSADAATPLAPPAELAEFLRPFVEPPLDRAEDLVAIGNHYLAVLGPPQQCASVESLVRAVRDHADDAIEIETQLLRVDSKTVAAVLDPLFRAAPAASGVLAQNVGERQLLLSRAAAMELLASLQRRPRVELVDAPRLTALQLQRATIEVARRIACTRSYLVEPVDGKRVAQAQAEQLFDGVMFDARAAALDDVRVGLRCSLHVAEVEDPLPTGALDLGTGETVPVHVPHTTDLRWTATATLTSEQSLLTLATRPDGSAVAALLRATRRRP